ncbi:MAG: YebC/PmpR family DNA-binding transcriptional regulator [Mycoplasma sp.]
MPRKHLIASGINKKQQFQAKIWMKCAKEIKAAAKAGGTNLDSNPRLRAAVNRALQNNLSRDSIEKNISGAVKENSVLKELYYEGYGPNGVAVLIKAVTDNEQRTISALRGYFSKLKGQIAKPNSVRMIFEEKSEFVIDKSLFTEDQILEAIIDFPVIDFIDDEDCYIVTSKPTLFFEIQKAFEDNKIDLLDSETKYIANENVEIPDDLVDLFKRFINSCEDDDDVSWVVTNLKNPNIN